jgi:hypothetical protein
MHCLRVGLGRGGVWVKKPDELMEVLAAGGSGYHFFDKLAPRMGIEKLA